MLPAEGLPLPPQVLLIPNHTFPVAPSTATCIISPADAPVIQELDPVPLTYFSVSYKVTEPGPPTLVPEGTPLYIATPIEYRPPTLPASLASK